MTAFSVQRVARIDSTNSCLLQWSANQPCHRVVLVADEQIAGRGQRGRQWHAVAGDALLCSVAWQFDRKVALDGLSLAVGVLIADALSSWVTDPLNALTLKWPNDLLIADSRKLGGILIETVASLNNTRTAVIGIGINLRAPQFDAGTMSFVPTGLADLAGCPQHIEAVLQAILSQLDQGLPRFSDCGFALFRERWWLKRAFSGHTVVAQLPDGSKISGRMIDITERGALVIESHDGMHTLVSGEVSLRAAGT